MVARGGWCVGGICVSGWCGYNGLLVGPRGHDGPMPSSYLPGLDAMLVKPQRFAARWSLPVWSLSCAFVFVILVVSCVLLSRIDELSEESRAAGILVIVVALALPCACALTIAFAPLGFAVTADGIVVRRMAGNVWIWHAEIARIERIDRHDVGPAIRVWGSGGAFGFFGKFYSRRLGWFRGHMTDSKDLVLVTRINGSKFVISPHPAGLFVAAAHEAHKRSAGS